MLLLPYNAYTRVSLVAVLASSAASPYQDAQKQASLARQDFCHTHLAQLLEGVVTYNHFSLTKGQHQQSPYHAYIGGASFLGIVDTSTILNMQKAGGHQPA